MTSRTIVLVAGAFAATFGTAWVNPAAALTPLAMEDAGLEAGAPEASAHAEARPDDFAPQGEESFEPAAFVDRAAPREQCVPFARRASGVEIYGNANTWWAQAAHSNYERTEEPSRGAVMTMMGYRTASRGHVAVVQEIVSDRIVLIDHANWLNNGEVTRAVPVRDVSPAGDWSQVQVWHVPGGHWGARVYRVQGFIVAPDMIAEAPRSSGGGWRQVDIGAPQG
jgi:surface antigen